MLRDKSDFLHEGKDQIFLQAGTIVMSDYSQACPNYPK